MNHRTQSKTFHFEEAPFSVKDGGIGETYHEVLILMNFVKTKPQVKSMNINCYDLFYRVHKNRG